MEISKEQLEKLPICACGNCLKRRLTTSTFTNFPYSKKLCSIYKQDFPWKSTEKFPVVYNKAKHTGFEGIYKEHLPTGLISTQKFDYKPYKVELKENGKEENQLIKSLPFFGRSSYECQFPNWGAGTMHQKTKADPYQLNIPLRGESNYAENYVKFPELFYKQGNPHIQPKPNLEFVGKFISDTTTGTTYQPINNKKKNFYVVEKQNKNHIEKSSLVPAHFPKNNLKSSYQADYIDLKMKNKCLLREKLNKLGVDKLIVKETI